MKCFQLATIQENTPAHGGVFYSATKYHIDVGLSDNFILSGETGGLGNTSVDDVVTLTITDQNDPNNKATYTYDYSNGCSGKITPMAPVNLNLQIEAFNLLRGKKVKAFIEFNDKCGGFESGTNFWLCLKS